MHLVTHTRLLLPSFLNCIVYIFTVNISFFLSFSFCYLVILLFRGCALHGSHFPVCTNPIGRSPCNLEFLCPIKLIKIKFNISEVIQRNFMKFGIVGMLMWLSWKHTSNQVSPYLNNDSCRHFGTKLLLELFIFTPAPIRRKILNGNHKNSFLSCWKQQIGEGNK
jgi:hypothetical protein